MRSFRRRNRPGGLRREGWFGRWLRLGAARRTIRTATSEAEPAEVRFTWLDVATVKRVAQAVAAIRAWGYQELRGLGSDACRLLARLDTAVVNRERLRTKRAQTAEDYQAFSKLVRTKNAIAELHRKASLWTRAGFACCVVFSTLAFATAAQALGIGLDLGSRHADLAQQIGNGLAWLASFALAWITTTVGKSIGTSFVNRSVQDLVKDARVSGRYSWLIEAAGLCVLFGALVGAAFVREGHLKLLESESPIPAWAFAAFTAAVEGGAILLGWATATPVADAERRLADAVHRSEQDELQAGRVVDGLVGEVAALMNDESFIIKIAAELEDGQHANAAEEIAIRAAANPKLYGVFDQLDIVRKAVFEPTEKPLETVPILVTTDPSEGASTSGYETVRGHVDRLAVKTRSTENSPSGECSWRPSVNGRPRRSPASR